MSDNFYDEPIVDYDQKKRDQKVVAVFRKPRHEELREDKVASFKAGHTVYIDEVFCEVRIPADRERKPVFPANAIWKKIDGKPVTYAMRFQREYQAFLRNEMPSVVGTPIEELPFIGVAKRLELKGLSVHTAEVLAGLDGTQLKALGMGGRDLKNQAQAWLERAAGSADITKYAAENAALKDQMEAMRADIAAMKAGNTSTAQPAAAAPVTEEEAPKTMTGFEFWDDADLRKYIMTETGRPAGGRAGHETLVRMAEQAKAGEEVEDSE